MTLPTKADPARTTLPAAADRRGLRGLPANHAARPPASAVAVPPALSPAQKAAVVLGSLSVEIAKEIVNELDDRELRAFAKAFGSLQSVAADHLNSVAREFSTEIAERNGELIAGADEVREILNQIAEKDRIDRLFTASSDNQAQSSDTRMADIWTRIEALDDDILLEFLKKQKISVVAAVFSRLGSEKSASLIGSAEPKFAQNILLELARRPTVSDAALNAIAQAMEEEILASHKAKVDYSAGGAVVGDIVNCLPSAKRDIFLAGLQKADTDIGAAVRRVVITFAELATRLPPQAASSVTREVDRDILLASLKYGMQNAPDTVEFLFANISKRMGEQMREEIDEMAALSEDDGEDAQRRMMGMIRKMADAGEISLLPADDSHDAAVASDRRESD